MNAMNQTNLIPSHDPAFNAVAEVVPHQQRWLVPYIGNLPIDQRMAALKALANQAGLRLPETILPEGTALIPYGEERKRALKADLDALPDLQPALDAYEARLRGERPLDIKVPLHSVRMVGDTTHTIGGLMERADLRIRGKLKGPQTDDASALGFTEDGFRHVAAYLKPDSIRNGFAENILALPTGLQATVFNHWAENSKRRDPVVLRTFWGGNSNIIRAVTSPSHSLETGDDRVIVEALRKLRPGAKVRITREPGGRFSELECIWPMLDRQLVVGDIAMGGVRISNSETKAGSLRVEAFVLRVLCLNFTTAYSEDEDAVDLRLRHVGDLSRRLPAVMQKAMDRIDPLVQAFGDAYRDTLRSGGFATRGELLGAATKKLLLPSTFTERVAQLWDADGEKSAGDTRAGFVNAMTRASQELPIEAAAKMERIAGRVVLEGWGALNG